MSFIMPAVPAIKELTLDEIGLLTTMLNVDYADYSTIEELTNFSSDSSTNLFYILNNLRLKEYIKLCNKKYFVNKKKILEMKIIN